jgi:TrmH family RNA methyltransferase
LSCPQVFYIERKTVLETILSKDNPRIRAYTRLSSQKKARTADGKFVLEGVKLLEEAVRSDIAVESVFITQDCLDSGRSQLAALAGLEEKTFLVSGAAEQRLAQSQSPQGVYAICRMPDHRPVCNGTGRFLGLWDIQDPGNVGTMIRTADALGLDGVILSRGCCDLYNLKTIRAAMGALFRMPILQTDMAAFLMEKKLHSFASVVDRSAPKLTETRFPDGSIVLIGNEGNGLSDEQVALCDRQVTIPMTGRAESFNAAMAATILMWEMMK